MRRTLVLLLTLGLPVCSAIAGTINVQVSNLGGGSYRYSYQLSGFIFQVNEELDFDFDAALYSMLRNDIVGPGFAGVIFQPNNPPGAPGEFGLSVQTNNPPFTGPFSIDFNYLGAGAPNGQQTFSLNLFDAEGRFMDTLETGVTSSGSPRDTIPEPASWELFVLGVIVLLMGLFSAQPRAWRTRKTS